MQRIRCILVLFFISILTVWALPTQAANIDFQTKVLPNGLKLVTKILPDAKTVSVRVVVPVGFLNEPRQLRGMSHLLEHLVYRGSERYSSADFQRQVVDQGGEYNGYTSLDHTEFDLEVLPQHFIDNLEIYLDQILHPQLDERDVALEKKIVTVEKALRTVPGNTFYLYLNALTEQQLDSSINSISRNDLANYHNQYYQLTNMTLIVTGRFDIKELQKTILNQVPPVKPAVSFTEPDWQWDMSKSEITLEDFLMGEQYQALFSFALPNLSKKELLVAKVLPYILEYESHQFDNLNDRPLDYQIALMNLKSHYFLILSYRDCQSKYSPEINSWHQKNLSRYCKYLKTKKFDPFLDTLTSFMEKSIKSVDKDSMSTNDWIAAKLLDPTTMTAEDLGGIRQLSANDFKNFVQKFLESGPYQKVVIKAK